MLQKKYTVRIYNKFKSKLKKHWNYLYLYDKAATHFQSFSWNCQFYKNFQSNYELKIFAIYSGNKIKSIFPMIVRKLGELKILEFIGSRMVDYLQPLYSEDEKSELFLFFYDYIKKNGYNCYIYDLNENCDFFKFLLDQKLLYFKTIECCVLPKGKFLEKGIVKEVKYDLRYLSRNAKFNILNSCKKSDLILHINSYLTQMQNKYGHLIKPNHHKFWKNLIFNNKYQLRILKIENEIAYSIMYTFKDKKLYLLNYYFNEKYKKFAPGKITLYNLIQEFNDKFDIDFSRGMDGYKLKFGCNIYNNNRFILPENSQILSYFNEIDYKIGFFPNEY